MNLHQYYCYLFCLHIAEHSWQLPEFYLSLHPYEVDQVLVCPSDRQKHVTAVNTFFKYVKGGSTRFDAIRINLLFFPRQEVCLLLQFEHMYVYQFIIRSFTFDRQNEHTGDKQLFLDQASLVIPARRSFGTCVIWGTKKFVFSFVQRYLHELCEPPVVHRNFKSANLLLDDDLSVRVSDCGLAPLISSGSVSQVSQHLASLRVLNVVSWFYSNAYNIYHPKDRRKLGLDFNGFCVCVCVHWCSLN